MNEEIAYWMSLAHANNFSTRRKMDFLIEVVHDKMPLEGAMKKIKEGKRDLFDFTEKEWEGIRQASEEIPNYSFLAEQLSNKGIHIIHVMDRSAYPATLKTNLKKKAPLVIYANGNTDLLHEKSIAIVGARNSSKISLLFTDHVAEKSVKEGYVIVSGFARGVDREALDAALHHQGNSIIVLPQGIETYRSKTYYPHIVSGKVLVISTYHPLAGWSAGLAMDRNRIIYGLAQEIYVAESNDHGGTWEGVRNGLKAGRNIFVRRAGPAEKNANNQLIAMGAQPVDNEGNRIEAGSPQQYISQEPEMEYADTGNTTEVTELIELTLKLLKERKGKGITTKELKETFKLDEKALKRLTRHLSSLDDIIKIKQGRSNYYYLKKDQPEQGTIF